MSTVQCSIHGEVPEAFICQHVLKSLEDSKPRGFVFSRDENGAINAWCDSCEDFVCANGNEWNSETEGFANISLVCSNCAKVAATLNNVEIDR